MTLTFSPARRVCAFVLLATLLFSAVPPADAQIAAQPDLRSSVVKIHTTARMPSLFQPWRKEGPRDSSGTGVVISGNRILTNAHVVAYATQVYIQPYQSADRIEAEVVAFAPGVDLALIQLPDDEQAFFEKHKPLPFAKDLPPIRGDVSAYGYPVGGDNLSVTKGIISRIEVASYKHGFTGLRIQVDAALNPGNSGGPAILDNQIVGIVFSGMSQADNIGYLIPVKEVQGFLKDAEDGAYEGRPELNVGTLQTLENDALRDKLGLNKQATGMLVTRAPDADDSPLKAWDVITHIGEHAIDNQGDARIRDDLRGSFRYFVHQVIDDEGNVPLTVIRDGEAMQLSAPAQIDEPALMPSLTKHNAYPRYFIAGPIVFSQATQEFANSLPPRYIQLFNYFGSPLVTRAADQPKFEDEEVVVIAAPMFDHRITKGYDAHHLAVVAKINGTQVKNLRHLAKLFSELKGDYVTIEFAEKISETLVFERKALMNSTEEILTDNGIRYQASKDLRDLLPEE